MIILAVLVVVGVVILAMPKRGLTPTTNRPSADLSAVTITTSDGIKLAATVKYPVRNTPAPAVILLHQYGADRHQWDAYLSAFLDHGFAVLSYDMRGFGNSRLPSIPTDQVTHLNSLPLDLPAVIAYLKSKSGIDPARISVVGASIGADVAFVGLGSHLGLYRGALLSPVVRDQTLDGRGVTDFNPSAMIGIASDLEQADLNNFMDRITDPKESKVIPSGGHGVELLKTTGVLNDVMQWISQ